MCRPTHIIILCLALVFPFSSLRGQVLSPAEVDSLLLIGDPVVTDSLCNLNVLQGDSVYGSLSTNVRKIDTASGESVRWLLEGLRGVGSRFETRSAGRESASLYRRFQELEGAGRMRDALKVYYTGMFFRNQFIRKEKDRLLSDYRHAVTSLHEHDIEGLRKAIADFQKEDRSTPAYRSLKDSLPNLYGALESRLAVDQSERERAAIQKVMERSWTFSCDLGMMFLLPYRSNDLVFQPTSAAQDWTFKFDRLPGQIHPTIGVTAGYYPANSISTCLMLVGGEILHADLSQDQIACPSIPIPGSQQHPATAHVFERFISVSGNVQWLTGSPVGLAPYVRLGLGAMFITRNEIDLHSYYVDYLPVPKSTHTVPHADLEGGVLYETGPSSLIAYKVGFCFAYNLSARGLVDASMLGLSAGAILNIR